MSAHAHFDHVERPLGGKIFTPFFWLLLALIAFALATVVVRMFLGLGAVTALSDAYPWGIWKPLNVVTYTGIAAGAYATGLVTYVFNKGEYHPFVRSCVVVGAMGYTLAGTSVVVDLGRWWNLWVVMWPPVYQLNSALLEVAVCVTLYMMVLWIETLPAVFQQMGESEHPVIKRIGLKYLPAIKKAMPFVIALAILLPTMHQSSLGALYALTPTKLHPFWHTYAIGGFFLISCWTMGFGTVVALETWTTIVWPRRTDPALLAKLGKIAMWILTAWGVLRGAELVFSGRLARGLAMPDAGFYGFWLFLEYAITIAIIAILAQEKLRKNRGWLLGAGLLLIFHGALYRFDTYLTGYMPTKAGAVYFPSFWEIMNSIGWAAIGVAVYIVMVKKFPMLSGVVVKKAPATKRVAAASH